MAKEDYIISSVVDPETPKTVKELIDALNSYKSILGELEKNTVVFKKTSQSIEELYQVFGDGIDVVSSFSTVIDEYVVSIEDAAEKQEKLEEEIKVSKSTFENLSQQIDNANDFFNGYSESLQGVIKLTEMFGIENGLLEQVLIRVKSAMELTQALKQIAGGIKTATTAFKAFNTVLKANPIILIASLIAMLIASFADIKKELSFVTDLFDDLWESVKELFPWMEKTSDIWNKFSQILSGVGTVIFKAIIRPFKILIKLLKFDLRGAFDEVMDTFNVVDNFMDAYNKKAEENAEKERQKREAEEKAKRIEALETTKYLLKENEARHGSNWKYTKEGKEMYDKYFEDLKEAYGEDSKEYQNALLEKLKYDREFKQKQDKAESDRNKSAQAIKDAEKQAKDEELAREKEYIEEYQKGIEKMRIESDQRLTNSLKGSKRVEYLDAELETLEEQRNSLLNTISDVDTSNEQRLAAQKEYENIIKEQTKLQTELNLLKKETEVYDSSVVKLESINQEIDANQSLIDSLKSVVELSEEGSIEQIDAQIKLNEATMEATRLREEQFEVEKEIKLQEIELEELLNEAKNPEDLTLEEKLKQFQDEANAQLALANDHKLSYEKRIAAMKAYDKAQQESQKIDKEISDKKKKTQEETLKKTEVVLGTATTLLNENTVAGKAAAVASATVDTYKAGASAMASTPGGPIMKAIALAGTIATGIANVKKILSVKTEGGGSASSGALPDASVAMPSMPEPESPIQETHNNMTANEEDIFNQPAKVFVVESDITQVQGRVNVVENETSF